ncbi:MAG TPA: GNAT family N-acetyltransferase [Tepidisphaeraceae bacterium]|jgi:GNAT superfamily N-acetyltransferase|nr:GNAT family N-acetyltransferase [Tepidisphaeraceae bacterium]
MTTLLNISELAILEESRQARAVAAVADVVEPLAGGLLSFSGPGSYSNQAVGLGMTAPVTGPELDQLCAFYESRGFQPQIELCPYAHESLIRGLAVRNFVIKDFETVLARDMTIPLDAQISAEIQINQVNPSDDSQVETLLQIVADGFTITNRDIFRQHARKALAYPNTFAYIASLDGVPAAGGSCELTAPCGALFGMTTLDSHRNRGLQRALMIARLTAAQQSGCKYVTIGSKPDSPTGRNALRIGFQVAYTKAILIRPAPGLLSSP